MPESDPIVLRWEQEGLPLLLRVLDRLDKHLEKIEDSTDDVDKSTKKLTKTQKGLATQVRKNSRVLTAFGDALSGADRNTGRFVRSSGRMIGAFARVASVGGGAGVAVAGVGLAAAAGIGGVTAFGSAVLDSARNAHELAEELKPFTDQGFFDTLSDGAQDARALNDAFDAATVSFKGAGLALANEFAPEMESGIVLATAIGLAIADSADEFRDFTVRIIDNVNAVKTWVKENPLVRAGLIAVTGGFSEVAIAAADFTTDLDDGGHVLRDYIKEARDLIDAQSGVNASLRTGSAELQTYSDILSQFSDEDRIATIALNAQSDTLDSLSMAFRRNTLEIDAQVQALEALGVKYEDNAAVQAQVQQAIDEVQQRGTRNVLALVNEENQARIDGVRAYAAEVEAVYGSLDAYFEAQTAAIVGGVTQTLDGIASLSGTFSSVLSEDSAKAAVALFRTQQAAGIASATISGFVAAQKALAELGPIAGPIAAVGIGATTAANVAAIAAQPPPKVETVNHTGAMPVAPGAGRAPGERIASIQNSEAVINTQGTTALLKAINSGLMGGGGGVARAVVGRGSIDRDFSRRGPQSATSRALTRQRRRASKGNPRY